MSVGGWKKIRIKMDNLKYHMQNFRKVKRYELDYHITENCNLNCVGCLHFSSIAEKEYIPIKKMRNELRILVEKLGSQLSCLKLLGGEPLLHPDIKKVLPITREICGNRVEIILLTNGIILPQMDSDFWDICRKNRIVIEVSQYPIKINYDELKNLTVQNSVEFGTFAYRNDFWKWRISDTKLSLLRKWWNFFYCSLANKCHTYRDGRLYTCCIAAHIHHFEKRFGFSGLYDVEANSISITDTDKIGRFLSRPIPMCRYCLIEKEQLLQQWKHSDGKIDEWK